MRSKRMARCMVVLIPFLAGGCAHNIPHPTNMNFDPQSMEYVGPVSAETNQGFVFCALPTAGEGQDLSKALAVALEKKGADAAINVLTESESGVFLGLYCWQTIRISGTAIKFKPSAKLIQAGGTKP